MDKKLKEHPDSEWNKGSGTLPVKWHPARLPICEKELKETLHSKGYHQQVKDYANVFTETGGGGDTSSSK